MSRFKIGQRVMCIDASQKNFDLGGLREGNIYTVDGLVPEARGIILAEIKSSATKGCYAEQRFVPLNDDLGEDILANAIKKKQTIEV